MKLTLEHVKSGVYGLAVGDALGVPVEFSQRNELDKNPVTGMREYGTHNQPKGTWSDDTSMVLATMDAMSKKRLNMWFIMDRFYRWAYQDEYTAGGKVFDIGGTTRTALHNWTMGELLEDCGGRDVMDNGNGSLMRMLPMAFYQHIITGDLYVSEELYDYVRKLSSITHAHRLSIECCNYYVWIARYILKNRDIYKIELELLIYDAIHEFEEYFFSKSSLGIIANTQNQTLADYLLLSRDEVSSTGFVLDSLIASLWCLCNTGTYKDAVLTAVNLGGDTDTIAAITGSLAGLAYGYDAIPEKWIKELQNKELINLICERFYNELK